MVNQTTNPVQIPPKGDCITTGTNFNTPNGNINIKGAICSKWRQLANTQDRFGNNIQTLLGDPTSNTQFIVQAERQIAIQIFKNGMILDVEGDNKPVILYGNIFHKYQSLNGYNGFLGVPITDQTIVPDKTGYFVRFENGMIYDNSPKLEFRELFIPGHAIDSTPYTHEIHGEILEKWSSLGFENGLGYPLTDVTVNSDGVGRFNRFQKGMIYWSPGTGAHEVHGEILKKWSSSGYELGYPLTDETHTPDGIGRFNRFQNGMIYWTPSTGAHEIHGAILDKWASFEYERSALGYPTSDETDSIDSGRVTTFQKGLIYWWPDIGAVSSLSPLNGKPVLSRNFTSSVQIDGAVSINYNINVNSNGDIVFTGSTTCSTHLDTYDYAFSVPIKTPSGFIYTCSHKGHVSWPLQLNPFESDFPGGTKHDDNWTIRINRALASVNWGEISQATVMLPVRGTSQGYFLGEGWTEWLADFINDLIKAYNAGKKAYEWIKKELQSGSSSPDPDPSGNGAGQAIENTGEDEGAY